MTYRLAKAGELLNGKRVRVTRVEAGTLDENGVFNLSVIEKLQYEVEAPPFPQTVGSVVKAKFKDDGEQGVFVKINNSTFRWGFLDDWDLVREDALELVEVVFEAPEGLVKR